MLELTFALRRICRRPAASLAAVATLACSIGAAAAVWSIFSAILLRPLPIKNAERWFVIGIETPGRAAPVVRTEVVYPVFDQTRQSGAFERVIATWNPPIPLERSEANSTMRVLVAFATHNVFGDLGVAVPVGRGFRPEDDRRGATPVAVLTHRYWRQAFNASPSVVGQTITIAGKPVTIVGVAARGFRALDISTSPDVYLPLHTIADIASPVTNYFADPAHGSSPTAGIRIAGRVRDQEKAPQVLAKLAGMEVWQRSPTPPKLNLIELSTAALPVTARPGMIQFGRLLATTVALLLLIGCATVGLLLLVRTEARRVEFATCLALGASVARLTKGVAYEAAVLSFAGAALAIPVAWALFWGLSRFQLPGRIEIDLLELRVDAGTFVAAIAAATLAFSVLTAVTGAFGFSARMTSAVMAHAAGGARVTRQRTRSTLVVLQVAVTLVLLVGANLFVRSLQAALNLNREVGMHRVSTGQVSLGRQGYDGPRAAAFFDTLRERVMIQPAIESLAYSVDQGGMGPQGKLIIDGAPRAFPSIVRFIAVDTAYFRTMGIALKAGRDFAGGDVAGAPPVAIVSESLARMIGPGSQHHVTMPRRAKDRPPDIMTVIGVVPDIVTDINVLEPLAMYFPLAQHDAGVARTIAIRATSGVAPLHREIVAAIKDLDPTVLPGPFVTLSESIDRQMGPQHLGSAVLGALGGIALLLTILGTYVVSESAATLRRQEMGIRAALGASHHQLRGIVLIDMVRLVSLGLVSGMALIWLGAQTIRAFLFQIDPLDTITLVGVATLLLVVMLFVSLRPAVRASRLDLARILNHD